MSFRWEGVIDGVLRDRVVKMLSDQSALLVTTTTTNRINAVKANVA